ncbi:DUF898 family protein [Magnetospirillum moscoviense]|uniref:Uncharacterized protein n=1 Tax=Magnetospirillum moscoviense TaxID=1437059 RepID=A0A178MQX8_9PROT|nr:DUF898 family protein [Magnetospirillum moscoviense]OAN51377.1 hypothetical protein A6A05_10950 [Magnetospirillum moscoviense]
MHPFQQTSNTGPVLRLALVNALLNLVTLTLWRFWGKTRVRRHLWSTTLAFGDPLTYTGTGRELFVGFLLVLLFVFLPMAVAYGLLQMIVLTQPAVAGLGFAGLYALGVFLLGAGLYRAKRYQLSRTRWRGIACGLDGDSWRYGLLFLASGVCSVLSLGLAVPWFQAKLARAMMSNTRIGDTRLECTLRAGPLYKRFLVLMACFVLALPLPIFLVVAAVGAAQMSGADPAAQASGITFLAMILLLVLMAFPIAWYRAGFYRHLAQSTSLTGQAFSFPVGSWGLIGLFLGNFALIILSFGILAPLTGLRLFRFAAAHLEIAGEPDFARITRSDAAAAGSAEGIVEVFDGIGAF